MCDIIFDKSACRVCHVPMLNLRQSSKNFGNSRKMFGNIRTTFGQHFENFRKSSEMVGNLRKIVGKLVGLYNKKSNTWFLGDMKFIFSCSNPISHSFAALTRELSI